MPLPKDIKPTLNRYVNIAIGTAQAFAVTKANKEVERILEELANNCPPPERLKTLVNIVETLRLVVVLSNRKVQKASKIADTVAPVIVGLTLLLELLIRDPRGDTSFNGNPLPVQFQPPGSPLFIKQETKGKSRRTQERVRWIQQALIALGDDVLAIRDAVSSAKNTLTPIQVRLDQISALIQACFENQQLTDEERKLLLDDIEQTNTDPAFNSIQYRSTSGRDYTIKIIKDPNSPDIAPKRQAIVQDFRGITVLTGPSSFASRPQILIEEIKFRIENQLP